MKSMLAALFKHRAEPTPEPAPAPKAAPSKRRYGKKRRPAPKGARRIDPNAPILEQIRK